MEVTRDELLAAAESGVTYPGAPTTLRVTDLRLTPGSAPRALWCFDDPHDPDEALDGATAVRGTAAGAWLDVQADAAWTFKRRVDADWVPGVPPTRRRWSPDEAWAALRAHLGGVLEEAPGEIANHRLVLRGVTPESWAAYLNAVDDGEREGDGDGYVVPVGQVHTEHLPQWAQDELDFGFGDAPALTLVDGELERGDVHRGTLRLVDPGPRGPQLQ